MRVALERPERVYGTEEHHVFGGSSRKWSDKYNCIVYLPRELHTGDYGVHFSKTLMQSLHEDYQQRLESAGWTREEFRETFGRSYL